MLSPYLEQQISSMAWISTELDHFPIAREKFGDFPSGATSAIAFSGCSWFMTAPLHMPWLS
jgi:hypothetical protein